jgi:hypothetical protein
MPKRALLAAAIFVLVACTGGSSASTSPAATADLGGSSTSVATTAPPTGSSGVNRLVIIDDGGNIVTIDPDGTHPAPITDDGGAVRYFQPIWSPVADRLAWGEGTSEPAVGSSAGDGSDRSAVPISSPTFYLNWAPDGSQVGVLYGAPQGVVLEVVDPIDSTTVPIGSGSPFYFSWSPDSTEMAVHVGGATFGTIEPGGELIDLGSTTPIYQALRWTPAGIFHIDSGGLEVVDRSSERLLAELPGEPVYFVPNAQGSKVAIESFTDEPAGSSATESPVATVKANAVSVLDVGTGEVDVASEDTSVGFFWSPDGEALLMLQLTGRTGEADVSVWNDGETTLLLTMTPPVSFFQNVLQFFDQYAQSLQLWSPDSASVALPGTIGEESGVWVIPTDGTDPTLVSDGSWVAWSYG